MFLLYFKKFKHLYKKTKKQFGPANIIKYLRSHFHMNKNQSPFYKSINNIDNYNTTPPGLYLFILSFQTT